VGRAVQRQARWLIAGSWEDLVTVAVALAAAEMGSSLRWFARIFWSMTKAIVGSAYLFRPMYAPRHAGAGDANMGHPSCFLRPLDKD
jgi:hypothetical protein